MYIIIDVILAAILVIFIIIGWKKGFIDMIMRLLSGLIAFLCALLLTPKIAPVVNDKLFYNSISNYMSSAIEKINGENGEGELFKSGDANDSFRALLDKLGADYEDIKASVSQRSESDEQTVTETVNEKAAKPVSYAVSYAICFIVIFLLAQLLLWILRHVLDLAAKLPVIKTANGILGLLVGLLLGVLIVWIISAMLKLALPYLTVMAPNVFPEDLFEKSFVLRLTYYLNVLRDAIDFSYIKRLLGH